MPAAGCEGVELAEWRGEGRQETTACASDVRQHYFSSPNPAEWLGNSRAVSPTVRCAADDVAAWSAAEFRAPPNQSLGAGNWTISQRDEWFRQSKPELLAVAETRGGLLGHPERELRQPRPGHREAARSTPSRLGRLDPPLELRTSEAEPKRSRAEAENLGVSSSALAKEAVWRE